MTSYLSRLIEAFYPVPERDDLRLPEPAPAPSAGPRPDAYGFRQAPPPSYDPPPADIRPVVSDPPFGSEPSGEPRPRVSSSRTGKPSAGGSFTAWELCEERLTVDECAWPGGEGS